MSQNKPFILALDLGGTRFRVAVADREGNILSRYADLTRPEEGRDAAIKRITKALRRVASTVGFNAIRGIGIAAPGPIDLETGVLLTPPNLPGWENTPMKSLWEEKLNLPVYVGNDGNLAAVGEHRFGAGRGFDHLIYIGVGTGIGGGVIIGGKPFVGAMGLASEVGHMTIDRNGPRCKCGNVGCLEALASGPAIARIAAERIAGGESSDILHIVSGNLEKISGETVVAAARSGDALAKEVLETAGINLGIGVVNLLHLFNPQAVIIGGGVSQAGDLIFDPVRKVVAERTMANFRDRTMIIPSALGDDAGLLGAVALVVDQYSMPEERESSPKLNSSSASSAAR